MKRPELMNPSAKVRRPLRPTALAGALALVAVVADHLTVLTARPMVRLPVR